MKILDNARNCMIDNFRSTKWFYHELEEIRERIGHMERIKDGPGLGYQIDQEERFNSVERRIQDLENYNQTLANHMISILNLMNDNIQTLTGVLEARGVLEKNEGMERGTARSTEEGTTETMIDQDAKKTQEQKEEDTQ